MMIEISKSWQKKKKIENAEFNGFNSEEIRVSTLNSISNILCFFSLSKTILKERRITKISELGGTLDVFHRFLVCLFIHMFSFEHNMNTMLIYETFIKIVVVVLEIWPNLSEKCSISKRD